MKIFTEFNDLKEQIKETPGIKEVDYVFEDLLCSTFGNLKNSIFSSGSKTKIVLEIFDDNKYSSIFYVFESFMEMLISFDDILTRAPDRENFSYFIYEFSEIKYVFLAGGDKSAIIPATPEEREIKFYEYNFIKEFYKRKAIFFY